MSDTQKDLLKTTNQASTPGGQPGKVTPEDTGILRRIPAGHASRGLVTIVAAAVLLFAVSLAVQPDSLSHSSLSGMLPFAAVLAIIALGQTLVIQHAGIDLSVPGTVSLSVVIVTHYPNGDSGKLFVGILLAYAAALVAGLINGLIVSKTGAVGDRHLAGHQRSALRGRARHLARLPDQYHLGDAHHCHG